MDLKAIQQKTLVTISSLIDLIRHKSQSEPTLKGYVKYFGLIFLLAYGLSFYFFRDFEPQISVELAKVEFKDSLELDIKAEGELKGFKSVQVTTSSPVRIDRFLSESAKPIKKDAIIAVTHEAENKAALESNVAHLKEEALNFSKIRLGYSVGKISRAQYLKARQEFEKSRNSLKLAQEKVEQSFIRSPEEGLLKIEVAPGESLPAGSTIAEVEDLSKLVAFVSVNRRRAKDIAAQTQVKVTGPEGSSQTLSAEVHYARAGEVPSSGEQILKVVFPGNSLPLQWLHQKIFLSFLTRPLKAVALIDPKVVVSEGNESKIAVMGPSGALRWVKITGAPRYKDKIVLTGVDPKLFRVVISDNPRRLNEAMIANVRAKI